MSPYQNIAIHQGGDEKPNTWWVVATGLNVLWEGAQISWWTAV